MNESCSTPSSNEAALLDFQMQLEQAADKEAFVAHCCVQRPHLAQRFRERAATMGVLQLAGPPPETPVPARLGEFQIIRRIGGGMEEVFEAYQPSLQRRVVIKTMRAGRISPEARERFLRQQKVLASLHQTHIVPIHAAGEEGPLHYFVMPYIDGAALHHIVAAARELEASQAGSTPQLKDLAERVAGAESSKPRQSPTTLATPGLRKASAPATPHIRKIALSAQYFRSVAQAMAAAAEALQYAHDAGILHRDLKPSNLMIDKTGQPWIIDFGLAGFLNPPSAKPDQPDTASDGFATSGVMGTPQYMAPEQWEGKADPRTDVWGLGVTLYELLTLRRAFPGESSTELKRRIQTEEPELPRKVIAKVPADLDAICRKAMHKDASLRYDRPRAMAEDLKRWLNHQPTRALPARPARRLWLWSRRNPGGAVAAGTAILTAFLLVMLGFYRAAEAENRAKVIEAENKVREVKAEAIARELAAEVLAKEGDRQALIRQAQAIRLNPRQTGWSKYAWNLLSRASDIRGDDTLRNEAGVSLIGLDAKKEREIVGQGAASLAFDSSGKKLLLGAQPKLKGSDQEKEPVRIWDEGADAPKPTKIVGEGPVAYDAQGRALALTLSDKNPAVLVLWDVDKEVPLREFVVPLKIPGRLLNLQMSGNGGTVAAQVALDVEKSTVIAWDVASGRILSQVEGKRKTILALSPDGKQLAAADKDGQIDIWLLDHEHEQQPATLQSLGRLEISALGFGRNPKKSRTESPWALASGDHGGSIVIWDLARYSVRTVWRGSQHDIKALAFSPDGATLAASGRGSPRIWNVANGQLLLELDVHDFASALAFSPDGQRLAIVNHIAPFSILATKVWRLENGRGLESLRGLNGPITRVEFSTDGSHLAALSQSWELGVWNLGSGQLLSVFLPPRGNTADNAEFAFSSDNRRLAFTTGRDGLIWDMESGAETLRKSLPPGLVDQLAFDAHLGKFISFRLETRAGTDWPVKSRTSFVDHPRVCRIRELSPEGIKQISVIEDFNVGVLSATMARNGSVVAVEGFSGDQNAQTRMIRIYSLPDLKEILRETIHTTFRGASSLPMDPEGKFFVYWDLSNNIPVRRKLLSIATGKTEDWPFIPMCLGPGADFALQQDYDPDENRVQGIKLHRRGQEKPLVTLATNISASYAAQFNRAGNRFAFGHVDGSVILCDLPEMKARLEKVRLGWPEN
ncbi:MAG: protein kinase [Planctomycetes bacterium]|nr:protein kinase [Planctomycetota bacterium]